MLISVIMGGSLIAMFAAGWVVNVKGKRAALVWGNVLVGLFCLAVLVTDSFLGALLALFFAGVGAAFQTPAGSKTVMTWFPIEQRGMSMGVRQTGIPLGGALLPFNALHRRLAHRGRERWPGCFASAALCQFVYQRTASTSAPVTTSIYFAALVFLVCLSAVLAHRWRHYSEVGNYDDK